MKKTVQIVIIPLEKEGWSEDDLVKGPRGFCIIPYKQSLPDWQAQQLLVLSDDEIQDNDFILFDNMVWKVHDKKQWEIDTWETAKKVEASYPHIERTLPISKETVQAWIDAGTPGEVELIVYGTFDGTDSTRPFLNPDNTINLDFGKDVKYEEISGLGKPSIPTQEEIEEKADQYAEECDIEINLWTQAQQGYKEGYKQALKDLGHIK